MADSLGKIFLFFILAILMFIFPAYYFSVKQDNISQISVYKSTVDFVNNTKQTGRITKDTYENFIRELEMTGNIYSIKIERKEGITDPYVDDSGNNVVGKSQTNLLGEYTDDILDKLYKDGKYVFKKGDYITVTVKNRNKTLASRLTASIGLAYDNDIIVTYGGLIRDEVE